MICCSKCEEEKPHSSEYFHKRGDKLHKVCKVCRNKKSIECQKISKDHINSRRRLYFQQNRESILEKRKEYHTLNKEKINKRVREYRKENREKFISLQKKYNDKSSLLMDKRYINNYLKVIGYDKELHKPIIEVKILTLKITRKIRSL
tara:strand:+ start:50 stop:493 length:444 start_codon:yes stop_codon:yes gene_type:complete